MASPLLEQFPRLRRVSNLPTIQRGLGVARRRRLVDERLRFVVGELRGGTRAYHLAVDRKYSVVIRHKTPDTWVLEELFRPPMAYAPPPAADKVLRDLASRRSIRILDLGGNVGLFAVYALSRYPGATVTSYEPEPENVRVLASCAQRNSFAHWNIVHACAMAADAIVTVTRDAFAHAYVCDFGGSSNGGEVPGIDVLPRLAAYDFIKMDIEGSEWPILTDARWPTAMRDVSVFVLEWHSRGCDAIDPRAAALAGVEAAGFASAASPDAATHGVIWGWRPSASPHGRGVS